MSHFIKKWGSEQLICNNELYCSKILHVRKNHMCSYHFHKEKDETFYVLKGCIGLEVNDQKLILKEGDSFRIKPRDYHRFIGIEEENQILEVSTHHEDFDSYRDTSRLSMALNDSLEDFTWLKKEK